MGEVENERIIPLVRAELIYAFLWAEFFGRAVDLTEFSTRFQLRMMMPLKKFVDWSGEAALHRALKEYENELFAFEPIREETEDGRHYIQNWMICPVRGVQGFPDSGLVRLHEGVQKDLWRSLPASDQLWELDKFNFENAAKRYGCDRFSVMATALWQLGYERRREDQRLVRLEFPEYAGRNFYGIYTKGHVKFVQVDGEENLLEENIAVEKFSDGEEGEFVVGCFLEKDGRAVLLSREERGRAIFKWDDFLEAERYESFERWMMDSDGISLCPRFRSSTRDVFLVDGDRLYEGLEMDPASHRVCPMTVRVCQITDAGISEGGYPDCVDCLFVGSGTDIVVLARPKGNVEWIEKFQNSRVTERRKKMAMFEPFKEGEEYAQSIGVFFASRKIVRWTRSSDNLECIDEVRPTTALFKTPEEKEKALDELKDGQIVEITVAEKKYPNVTNIMAEADKYVVIRDWKDFKEHSQWPSLEGAIVACKTGRLSLTPAFQYYTLKIIVESEGYLYAGFSVEFKNGNPVVVADDGVWKSKFTWDEIRKDERLFKYIGFMPVFTPFTYNKKSGKRVRECKRFDLGPVTKKESVYLYNKRASTMTLSEIEKGDDRRWIKIEISREELERQEKERKEAERLEDEKRRERLRSEEIEFLKRFAEYVKMSGFKYDPRDLIRFHTAAKCGLLTILSGKPGVGKSSLARLYAEVLVGKRLKPDDEIPAIKGINVSPSWIEPEDFIGGLDYQNRLCRSSVNVDNEEKAQSVDGDKFSSSDGSAGHCRRKELGNTRDGEIGDLPASNGLYRYLFDAVHDEQGRMYPVVLEELNLAHFEYYGADLLQMMSGEDWSGRKFSSVRDISLGENVRMFGTCNQDHTVQQLSPRLLDRCNFIELNLGAAGGHGQTDADGERTGLEDPLGVVEDGQLDGYLKKAEYIPAEKYNKWMDGLYEHRVAQETAAVFRRLKADWLTNMGAVCSGRTMKLVRRYLWARPAVKILNGEVVDCDEKERQLLALDEALAQLALPKCLSGVNFDLNELESLERILRPSEGGDSDSDAQAAEEPVLDAGDTGAQSEDRAVKNLVLTYATVKNAVADYHARYQ